MEIPQSIGQSEAFKKLEEALEFFSSKSSEGAERGDFGAVENEEEIAEKIERENEEREKVQNANDED